MLWKLYKTERELHLFLLVINTQAKISENCIGFE